MVELLLRADDMPLDAIEELGTAVVEIVGEKRSTWRRWNLMAEASRQTMRWRFASMRDREAIVGMIADAAEQASLRLTPPDFATSPAAFRRVDGTSVFRPKHSTVFSSELLLAAEDRLLDRSRVLTAPTVSVGSVEKITSRPDPEGRILSEDQADALMKIAVSGRMLDVLVGPAGAGKTTAMNALRRAWEVHHGAGSVVGLAPSAVAAQVLADDLGIQTENTAKWWQNHLMHGTSFDAGQLVIIDEASLAGSLSLDRITHLAERAGAKVLLVGDFAQLHGSDRHLLSATRRLNAPPASTEPTTTRENFYVSMTRGKRSNHAYVVLDRTDDDHGAPHPGDNPDATARSVLYGVLQHVGAELSANETITNEHEQWGSVAQLAAEYETVAAAAQRDRWATLIRNSGLNEDQASAAVDSDTFGALTAELRRAEANHHDLDRLLPRLVAARGFGDANDIASVLHHRVARATARQARSGRVREAPRLIAGLVPAASGPMADDMRQALDERRDLIEKRADALLDSALNEGATWTKALGSPPRPQTKQRAWRRNSRTVAAYRDRFGITDVTPLGPTPVATAQKIDASRAKAALDRARSLTTGEEEAPGRPRGREPLGHSL